MTTPSGLSSETGETRPQPASSFARIGRLARKELSEVLRDRRTVVTLVAMPLLLYPLMSIAFQQFFLASRLNPARGIDYQVGCTSELEGEVFLRRLHKGEEELERRAARRKPAPEPKTKIAKHKPILKLFKGPPDEIEGGLETGKLDLVIRIPDLHAPLPPAKNAALRVDVEYNANAPAALGALAYVEARLAAADEADLRARLDLPGGPRGTVVLSLTRMPRETAAGDTLVSLPALIPLVLILMTITGAVYPAIDLTAGERERGTLEILVAAPVPRFELLAGKYLAVVTVAVLTALVNVLAMAVTLSTSGLGALLFASGTPSAGLLLLLFGLLLLFAAFFSALLLCLTSFARNFKEAQAYLIPLMLVSLAPGILAMMPGLQLNLGLALVPLVNIVLLARDLFAGSADGELAVVVVVATVLYALAALNLAARVFGSENVLYSEGSGWSDLFRRAPEPAPAPSVSAALWCLALMVPLWLLLQALAPVLLAYPGLPALAVTIANFLMFGALPLAFGYLGHVELKRGFRLLPPRPVAILSGGLLGLSLWPLVLSLLSLQVLPEFLEEQTASVRQSLRAGGWLEVLPLVTAAVFEELYFRGFLFQALRRVTKPGVTVGLTALLFGVTHAVMGGAVGLGQFLPSTLLGLVLGLVCWLSGSVWPSLILHVCHNAVLLSLAQTSLLAEDRIPIAWNIIGGAVALLALGLLVLWGRRNEAAEAEMSPGPPELAASRQ